MWSGFATVVAIAIASNLDNAGVGIAYGVRRIRIGAGANSLIAVISGLATWIAGVFGHIVTQSVNGLVASWMGAAVMMTVGIWVLTEPWRSKREAQRVPGNVMTRILRDPVQADFDNSESIGIVESVVLGIALAINALAGGFDAGVARIGIVWTALSVAVFSFVLLGFSAYIGRRYASNALGDKATYVAGVLLIVIGIHQIW